MKYQYLSALIAAAASATTDVAFTSLGKFQLKNAAFPTVSTLKGTDPFLLCSSFSALAAGAVYIVPGITAAVKSGDVSTLTSVKLTTPDFKWPNDVKVIPYDVFNQRAIVVPDGFLVPGKQDGGVYVVTIDSLDVTKTIDTYKISPDKPGYFYHMGEWIDLNGDGRKDFLTARSNSQKGGGELVWFEHPINGLTSTSWTEHIVSSGPDVNINVAYVPQFKGEVVVFAAEFFNENLAFYRISTSTGTLVAKRDIDSTEILSAYSVTYTDLNADGSMELLVNNHEKSDSTNGIWVYQFPTDWMTGTFSRTTIAHNFKNKSSLTVPNMSPGFPYAFYPQVSREGRDAAHILVAGDGDHTAHILTPTDARYFIYDIDTIKQENGTVGALAWGDLDSDGWNELWVPDYDNSQIEVFKFSALKSIEFLQ